MNQRRIVALLIGIMAVACLSIAGVTISTLYKASMQEERVRLMETAKSQARLIEAIARFDKRHSREYPGGSKAATISQVLDAHEQYTPFGKTGEFVISERVGDQIVFLCRHRHANLSIPEPLPFISDKAEPMRRALSGMSGTVVGLDYEGNIVLAAHEPVDEIDVGIVAKIDLAEVREPFLRAGLIVLLFTVVVVLIGAGLFVRIAGPVVVGLEDQNAAVKKMNREITKEIAERKRVGEALARSEQELANRNRISEIFLAVSDEDMYREVMKIVLEQFNSECGAFSFADEGGTRVVPVYTDESMENGRITEKDIMLPEGTWGGDILSRCRQDKKAIISEGPFDLPRGHISLTRVMAAPIMHRGAAIGSLMVGNRPSRYNESDNYLLETIADFIAPIVAAKQQQDILERKRQAAEHELQEAHNTLEQRVERRTAELNKNKALLQKVFDGFPDPLYLLDENMRIKILNTSAARYYRIEKDKAINEYCHQTFRGRSAPCEGCEVPLAMQHRVNLSYERKGVKDPNRLEQLSVYQIKDEHTRYDGAILRIHDITESKMVERQTTQNEKLASLGLMVSSITHEIANPVNAVTFNAPILRDYIEAMISIVDEHAENDPDLELVQMPYPYFRKDAVNIVNNMLHASARIESTVKDLRKLYVSRKDRAKHWVELREVFDGVTAVVGVEINQRVKSFEVNLPEDLPSLYTDSDMIEQILTNLLTNAMHAADKEKSWVKINVTVGNTWREHLIIEVSDNGCGMDEDTRSKIFKPFFTTKSPGMGTGLGLYVCQDLVQDFGGKIEVQSELGKGTVFRVVLPDHDKRAATRVV